MSSKQKVPYYGQAHSHDFGGDKTPQKWTFGPKSKLFELDGDAFYVAGYGDVCSRNLKIMFSIIHPFLDISHLIG